MARPLVFLSYCHDDGEQARTLHDDLCAAGFKVWWDKDILPGQDWRLEIHRAMRDSSAVILCLSHATQSRRKSGIFPEARDAIAAYRELAPGSIFLIPVRFSECEVPFLEIDSTRNLADLQYVDLFPDSRRKEGLQRLVASIRLACSPASSHRAVNSAVPGWTEEDADAAARTILQELTDPEMIDQVGRGYIEAERWPEAWIFYTKLLELTQLTSAKWRARAYEAMAEILWRTQQQESADTYWTISRRFYGQISTSEAAALDRRIASLKAAVRAN